MKILYKTLVGSRLYGFHTETSDFDYKGFAFPELDEILGLKTWEQTLTGKDDTVYSLKKFLHLSLKGNPTILEISFADSSFATETTEIGERVRKFIRENVLTKALYFPYKAYFDAQLRKLQRPNREGKRQELIDKYSYDVKFAAHAYRLGQQCIEIFSKGTFNPTMEGEYLKNVKRIRNGELDKEMCIHWLTVIGQTMEFCFNKNLCEFPEKPNFSLFNDFLVSLYKDYLCTL